ncbi:response regulator transcription factor [Nocardioides marinus]|uniref:DNA-binding response OmpR family regulator n=1 Tax=Nocardioides marinus TaxID=374514 RepID=A0A7Y9YH35_9ACTN|nr:response regulator transcription factor [Nocardioides marinus]NYI10952.1 DNA-binding response OmpR family regulator [Nocardioides marinus]
MQPWVAVVIEDDPAIREILDMVLQQNGFSVVLCADGQSGLAAIGAHRPLLTTCDVQMPGMDGFAVARRIRRSHDTYLIMITAMAEEIDVVQGLEAGADDYLVKPFSPRELRARVDAMLRRLDIGPPRGSAAQGTRDTETAAPAPTPVVPAPSAPERPWLRGAPLPGQATPTVASTTTPSAPVVPSPVVAAPASPIPASPIPATAETASPTSAWLTHDGLALHPPTRSVVLDERPIDLTATEFDLLAALLGSGSRVRSKADLVLAVRGQGHVTAYFVNDADKRTVEAHVASLRRKLGDTGPQARFVEDVRGVGYRLAGRH